MDTSELNMALAKALGVSNLKRVTRVTLVLEPSEFPLVTVDGHLQDDCATELAAVSASYRLKPSEV